MIDPRDLDDERDLLTFLTEAGLHEPAAATFRGVELVITSTGTSRAVVIEDAVGALHFTTTLTSRLQVVRDLRTLAEIIGDRRHDA